MVVLEKNEMEWRASDPRGVHIGYDHTDHSEKPALEQISIAKRWRQASNVACAKYPWRDAAKNFAATCYLTYLTFTQTQPLEPQSAFGKLALANYAFFVLVLGASYTANLAAFLTNNARSGQYTSLEQVLTEMDEADKICSSQSMHETLKRLNPKLEGRLFDIEDETSFDTMDMGGCVAAIEALENAQDAWSHSRHHCNKEAVGDIVAYVYVSFPVREDLEKDISSFITHFLESGAFSESYERHKTEYLGTGSCTSSDATSSHTTLNLNDMGGAFILLYLGLGLLLCCSGMRSLFLRRKASVQSGSMGLLLEDIALQERRRHSSAVARTTDHITASRNGDRDELSQISNMMDVLKSKVNKIIAERYPVLDTMAQTEGFLDVQKSSSLKSFKSLRDISQPSSPTLDERQTVLDSIEQDGCLWNIRVGMEGERNAVESLAYEKQPSHIYTNNPLSFHVQDANNISAAEMSN
ncbi:hypothetical protein CYMTET_40691 [Cymbomonas tetramitiformis]|uniref:Ionotropic glutamate receptor C-terminal domain-containing protein n=1 Tax=Cymbomonas tetramitiformis TaxID=36881 RepID=A0AAE0C7N4_9CHLO|nr:hypothetical protein CYMTET_40691 [Cymbomonas tetramitiformis]